VCSHHVMLRRQNDKGLLSRGLVDPEKEPSIRRAVHGCARTGLAIKAHHRTGQPHPGAGMAEEHGKSQEYQSNSECALAPFPSVVSPLVHIGIMSHQPDSVQPRQSLLHQVQRLPRQPGPCSYPLTQARWWNQRGRARRPPARAPPSTIPRNLPDRYPLPGGEAAAMGIDDPHAGLAPAQCGMTAFVTLHTSSGGISFRGWLVDA
jgi:hypothetical protein